MGVLDIYGFEIFEVSDLSLSLSRFLSLSLSLSECVRLDGPASSPPVDLYQMRAKAGFQTKHTHTINNFWMLVKSILHFWTWHTYNAPSAT